MRVFTAVIFLGTFLVLIGMPEEILSQFTSSRAPGPHEVWDNCGTWCEDDCANYGVERPCIAMCRPGWVCKSGYVRATAAGNCILLSECPARSK